jgi:exosortase
MLHRLLLWLVAVQLAALFAPTAIWLWDRWTLSVWHHAHGPLIVVVVGYLIWKELRELRHLPASASAWGFAFLIPALILHALDAGMHTQLASALALWLALPGLALLLLGTDRTRAIGFPLAFLAFSLPIPLVMTEHLHLVLREIATGSAAFLLPRMGLPIFAEGTTLHMPNGSLQISDACSGFSTLYAACAVACLTAYMCATWRRRLLVLLVAAPVAIAANVVRVVLLAFLVTWYGVGILETPLHTMSGMLTFVLALPVIFWLGQSSTEPRVTA